MIYKLLRAEEWAALQKDGVFRGSPVDLKDGFIHFSDAGQAEETAARHFEGVDDLVLAQVDPQKLPKPPVWEVSRGGAKFPHLYAPLPLSAVTQTWTLSRGAGGRHQFPETLKG